MTAPTPPPDNTINDLRRELFDTIRGLKNKSVDTNTAKAISNAAANIINSVKVEIDFMKISGTKTGSGFIPVPAPRDPNRLTPEQERHHKALHIDPPR